MDEWIEPAADARLLCGGGVVLTWAQMTENQEPEYHPAIEAMYRNLLWAFGAVAIS